MQDAVYDNLIRFEFKEHAIIASAQSIAGLKLHEALDVALQIGAGGTQFLDHPLLILQLQTSEIFLGAGLKDDLISHT